MNFHQMSSKEEPDITEKEFASFGKSQATVKENHDVGRHSWSLQVIVNTTKCLCSTASEVKWVQK